MVVDLLKQFAGVSVKGLMNFNDEVEVQKCSRTSCY